MEPWMRLGDIVRSGEPLGDQQAPDPGFFEELVPAIAPLSMPAAQLAATELRLASAGPISILDIGGGSGVFDAVWLRANPLATATQIDFPNVNRVAREYVGRFGVGDRFRTVDGDFHTTDLGVRVHDVAIYSHIAHMESVEQNAATLRRIHASLKPAGSLVLNDFVLEDDRSGPPFPLLFHANMLVKTRGGSVYRAADYRAWLQESGFRDVRFVVPPGPSTLVFARA
jgi:ubiquinone/menaquinone biosynthesis C-methylase UbiE